jgi:uncharacterized membrane protein YkoI
MASKTEWSHHWLAAMLIVAVIAGPTYALGYQQYQTVALTLEEAAQKAREQSGGGEILKAVTEAHGGRSRYAIRVVTPTGVVRTYFINAETGEVE